MESATVRVRPLRFAFAVEPKNKASLQRVFEVNSSLWGGVFNFIIPLIRQVPSRYREKYFKAPPAKAILKGLVEAFQSDYLVEIKPGDAVSYGIAFPAERILAIEDLTARDDRGRCKIGIDLRSVCDDLYRTSFRFVQRHPPSVLIPSSTETRFGLLFSATFGSLPESGALSDVADIYLKALDGKRKAVDHRETHCINRCSRSSLLLSFSARLEVLITGICMAAAILTSWEKWGRRDSRAHDWDARD